MRHLFIDTLESLGHQLVAGGKTDFSKCFDRVSLAMGIRLFRRLGTPEPIASLLIAFYVDLRVCFTNRGITLQVLIKRRNGLLQGCPFSVLILVAVTTCFLRYATSIL